jgi:hypothetical protein
LKLYLNHVNGALVQAQTFKSRNRDKTQKPLEIIKLMFSIRSPNLLEYCRELFIHGEGDGTACKVANQV